MAEIIGSFEKYDGDVVVKYKITEDMQEAIVKRLLKYYKKNQHDGEGIYQDDDSIIDAPIVLSDIADDIIEFQIMEIGD